MTTKSPFFAMTPDFSPLMKMMAFQAEFAMQATQGMMQLAMMPWQGLQGMAPAYGSICTPFGVAAVKVAAESVETAQEVVEVAAHQLESEIEAAPEVVREMAEDMTAKPEPAPAPKVMPTPTPKAEAAAAPAASTAPAAKADTPTPAKPAEATAPKAEKADAAPTSETGPVQPAALKAAKGTADDLTVLNGVGPKLAQTLNEFGIFHLDQVAKWTDQNVAWMDENLPGVKGRASKNGWVAQAVELSK